MKKNLRIALFTGLLTGLLFGTIDIIARIVAFSFEWFEFYQTLFLSMVTFMIIFLIIGVVLEFTGKLFNKKIFYSASAFSLLLLIYLEILLKVYVFPNTHYGDSRLFVPAVLVAILCFSIFLFLVFKANKIITRILRFWKRSTINNYIFLACVFILASFIADIYLLNQIPSQTSEETTLPNIILITLDTVRADHLSLYGYSRTTTPNLDLLADKSIVFENAIAPSPWTLPSHASLFTGKLPISHNAIMTNQILAADEFTLAEILRKAGYNTAGFVSGPYCKARYGIGQGFTLYKDRLDFFEFRQTFSTFSVRALLNLFIPGINKLLGYDGERTAEEVNKNLFKWLEKNKDSKFFAFVNYFDAHHPYNLGEEFNQFINDSHDSKEISKLLSTNRYGIVSKEVLDYTISKYDTEIYYLDYHLGELFDKLDQLNLEDTILIITADHGEEFYEHGGFRHTQTLYEEVIHVPLIIYYPGHESRRIPNRIGITNLFPTILDMAKADIPENIDSVSLISLINNQPGYDRNYIISELFARPKHNEIEQHAISMDDYKLIQIMEPTETLPNSLFNLEDDPREMNNLYGDSEKQALLQEQLNNLIGK